jgi:endonuclease I
VALADPPPGYYSAVNGLTGAALKDGLRTIIATGHTPIAYENLYPPLKRLWEDPANSSNVLVFYSSASLPKSATFSGAGDWWNREHLWPRSRGVSTDGGPDDSDLFHVVPCDNDVNVARGTLYFDNSSAADGGITNPAHPKAPLCTRDSNSWQVQPSQRGDVARALFYLATRYDGTEPGTTDLELVKPTPGAAQMANLDTLLAWHAADPPDAAEMARNDLIFSDYQHNRNPFIDHPEWVGAIWGSAGAGLTALAQGTDTTAVESPNSTGTFLVQLSGPAPAGGVTVSFAVSGTATPADYMLSGSGVSFSPGAGTGTVAIAAGASSAAITLTPVDDGVVEGSETARLRVTAGAGYTAIGGSAVVVISDSPPGAPTGTIATWNFDAAAFSDPVTATTGPGAVRLNQWLGGVDSFSGVTGQSLALVRNSNGNGSWIDVETSTLGSGGLVVEFWTRNSGSGFTSGTWSYSVDGVAFETLSGLNTATTSTTFVPMTVDLRGVPLLNNQPSIKLRYTLSGATAAAGNNRIDDLVIRASTLPRVTVVASDAEAHESGADPAVFTFTSDLPAPAGGLNVAFVLGGTATPGVDYVVGGTTGFDPATGTGTVLIAAGTTAKTITVTPLADGNPLEFDESITVQVLAPGGGAYAAGTPTSASATLRDATPYNPAWAARFPGLTPALAAPALDLDGDGLNNLLEFAFDANPFTYEAGFAPEFGSALFPDPAPSGPLQRFATLSFVRRIDAHAPGYTPQSAASLGAWSGAPVFVGTSAGPTSATERVTYRAAQPMTGPNAAAPLFFRILVTAAP